MLLGAGLGWAGILAALGAPGGRTVSIGFGALDLTAVWGPGWIGGRVGAVGTTEHTTGKHKKQWACEFKNKLTRFTKSYFLNVFLLFFALTLLNNRSRRWSRSRSGFRDGRRFGGLGCRWNGAGGFVHQQNGSIISFRRWLEHPKITPHQPFRKTLVNRNSAEEGFVRFSRLENDDKRPDCD